jgi:CRP/FNR family cyclic AMP-dependent transcriptional regulator
MKTELLKDNLELVMQLKNIPALDFFGKQDLKKILNFSTIKKFEPGEKIIEEGSFDNWDYFLISGNVKVLKNNEEIDVLRRTGDIFGEMCIIDGSPRSASIVAVDEVTCLATDVSFVDSLFSDDKVAFCAIFYQIISEVLARRLRDTSDELVRLREELAAMKKQ